MMTLRSWKGSTGRMWHLTLPYMGRMLMERYMTLWVNTCEYSPVLMVFPIVVCVFVDVIHKGLLIIVVFITSCSLKCWSCVICCTPAGSQRVEHLPSGHHFGYCWTWKWHHYWGCQYTLLVFWHVEDHLCMAHWGHGPLQYQLLALWRAQIMVKTLTTIFLISAEIKLLILTHSNIIVILT